MEFKGTKGKWQIGEIKHSVWGENRKGCIADCTGVHNKHFYIGFTSEESEANALLISKAPEMLEMLKRFVKSDDLQIEDFIEAEQLIKEATEL